MDFPVMLMTQNNSKLERARKVETPKMNSSPVVLNVEDTAENRFLVRRILESEDYSVVDAENALEGIRKAVEISPDLILMDINLPDLDGFTAVTRIRSYDHLRTVPIIALTARTVSNDRERAKAIGCDGYLNKPIDFEELLGAVAHHIAAGHMEKGTATEREYYLHEQSLTLIGQLEQKITELETAYARLKHLEQAKSDFISVVSHELRTPLTLISSYSQMLQTLPALQSDAAAKEFLGGVSKGASRLQEIINDMVSVIRVELVSKDLKFAPVALRSIIKSIAEEQAETIGERCLTLDLHLHPDLPMINGDSKQLHSALSRIVSNAVKYTPDGGRISVSTQLKTNGAGQFVETMVADTGVGVDLEKQKLIFDKFTTAENVALHSTSKTQFMGGGIGLGLTIAKGVIEAHNGRIWVESEGYDSEKLPGSKFFVLLPTI
jgi:signal transduction histidine kinase